MRLEKTIDLNSVAECARKCDRENESGSGVISNQLTGGT